MWLRFIDILANNSIVKNAVQDGRPAELASARVIVTPASFTVAQGKAYDFTFTPDIHGKIEFK